MSTKNSLRKILWRYERSFDFTKINWVIKEILTPHASNIRNWFSWLLHDFSSYRRMTDYKIIVTEARDNMYWDSNATQQSKSSCYCSILDHTLFTNLEDAMVLFIYFIECNSSIYHFYSGPSINSLANMQNFTYWLIT